MAGYWPSSFFWVVLGQDEVEVHKHAKKKKKERGQYRANLAEQAWSIKETAAKPTTNWQGNRMQSQVGKMANLAHFGQPITMHGLPNLARSRGHY